MKTIPLGNSALTVSRWCLGTMTFGNQTPEDEAHAQMDASVAAGVTFMDCAEMYPVAPVRAETVGRSEEILGTWLAKRGKRDDVQIATKVTGPNGGFVRDGRGFDGATVREAIDGSLRRLQTDVIDLYQLHWPERDVYHFRDNWSFAPRGNKSEILDHMGDVLDALDAAVKAGKIREVGLSNETAWGTARWIDVAEQRGAPRMVSMQNEFSLLCRLYDTDMAEMATYEDVTLLAYSPLATGLLSGKYQNGAVPDGSRMSIVDDLGGRRTDRAFDAVDGYLALARDHGVDPVHMAIAWTTQRPFACIPIFGATRLSQLEHILAGRDTVLSDELLRAIEDQHKACPMPY